MPEIYDVLTPFASNARKCASGTRIMMPRISAWADRIHRRFRAIQDFESRHASFRPAQMLTERCAPEGKGKMPVLDLRIY